VIFTTPHNILEERSPYVDRGWNLKSSTTGLQHFNIYSRARSRLLWGVRQRGLAVCYELPNYTA